jgi:DNA-binding NtrC family response regulator
MPTVLVVDDERLIRDLIHDVLTRQGYDVVTAGSGSEALGLFKERRPLVTLLDLRMPDVNGLMVLKELRAIDQQAAVIVLTGVVLTDLETEARKLGVTDFLQKGGPLGEMLSAVDSVRASQVQSTDATTPGAKGSILVVDDEEDVRKMITEFLSDRGYWVVSARNGQEALMQVDFEHPSVIVLDLRMPNMNGLEVLQELRRRDYRGRVIVFTGLQDEALLEETLKLGALDVLGKPVDLERLQLTIEVGLTLSAQQGNESSP